VRAAQDRHAQLRVLRDFLQMVEIHPVAPVLVDKRVPDDLAAVVLDRAVMRVLIDQTR
jgi:hypothetical protein